MELQAGTVVLNHLEVEVLVFIDVMITAPECFLCLITSEVTDQ